MDYDDCAEWEDIHSADLPDEHYADEYESDGFRALLEAAGVPDWRQDAEAEWEGDGYNRADHPAYSRHYGNSRAPEGWEEDTESQWFTVQRYQ